jgi:extradiol dioxygenase family protein
MSIFHLAFHVRDLDEARRFYGSALGCAEVGQPGEQWTMFFCDPFGNPIEAKGFRSLDTVYDT